MAKKGSVNFNDLSTWTLPLVLLISLIIVGLIFILAKNFFADKITQQINSENKKIVKQEQEYEANQKIVALLPHIRKEVAELEIVRDEAKQYLPTKVSMPSLIDNVYLAARDNGIVFNSFTPEVDIDTEFYTIKPISLSADVGYLSMSSFIEQVTTLKRIMNVQSVSFASESKGDDGDDQVLGLSDKPLRMTAQLRTYIFKEDREIKQDKK